MIIHFAYGRMAPTLNGILMQKANDRAPRLFHNGKRRVISPCLADDPARYRQLESDLSLERLSDLTFSFMSFNEFAS